jgi:putative MATE family efflux protein
MLQRYIGDKVFYRRVLAVALPIIVQNGITNFVSLLDNIMVGQVGTLQMSGVAIVNQLLFVFNLCIFGAVSGAGIFTAQFFGSEDHQGVRHTFRFKILVGALLTALGISVFLIGGKDLIGLYLQGEGSPEDIAHTLRYGWDYLLVMLWSLPAFAFTTAYSSTLREGNQTLVPMVAGISAILINLFLNYVLIFGHFGFPEMGIRGAALATVIARYCELTIVAGWTHLNRAKNAFIQNAYRSMHIPGHLLKHIILKGMPLLVNEALWSIGMAMLNQSYSTRGLDVVAAQNISSTIYNLSSVVFLSMGNAVGIIMGQMLGANKAETEIRDYNRKLMVTSVFSCLVFGGLMAACSGLFPRIYNTTENVQVLATRLILISATLMPFNAYTNACYFTLRSGGKTLITFLFDSCYVWTVCVPLAFVLSRFTALPILPLYAICNCLDILKCAVGAYMVHQGKWIQNLVLK